MKLPRWLWLILLLALLWSWSLYLAGFWLCPKGQRYFWVTLDVSDYNAHLIWARQAWEGKNRFVNLHTTERHPPLAFNLHDWLIGRFARSTGISLHLSMGLFHALAVLVFVFAAWWLSRPFLAEEQQRTYLIMLCFLGGVPWEFLDMPSMPEANTYMALTTMSWFVWAKGLLALLIGSLMRALDGNYRWMPVGITAGAILGNIHPYALAPIGYGIVLWFAALLWTKCRSHHSPAPLFRCSLAFLFLLPAFMTAAWQAWTVWVDPTYRALMQFPLETPPIWDFALNYGVIGIFAFLAVAFLFTHAPLLLRSPAWLLLVTWLIGAFLAVYLTPIQTQRKLIEGVHLPMCILASWAWHQLVLPRTVVIRRYPLLVLILLGGTAPFAFWFGNFRNFHYSDEIAFHRGAVPYYVREQHLQLIEWLEKNTHPDDAILCAYPLGNYLPVFTGRRVFIGHWAGTLQMERKLRLAQRIWMGEMPVAEAQNLFRKHRLRYALATMYERHETKQRHKSEDCSQVTEQFHLDRYGEVVYRVGDDAIYRLRW